MNVSADENAGLKCRADDEMADSEVQVKLIDSGADDERGEGKDEEGRVMEEAKQHWG